MRRDARLYHFPLAHAFPSYQHSSYARLHGELIGACHETDCVLRRFRPDRRDYRLFHRSICGTLVGTCEFAGVPRLFFHCFLGRMAARNPRHLIFSLKFTVIRNRRDG